ncbi:MAG: pantetheine-phosphate adenylyltransferase [Candidatus Cloacimonetes bacterium 4572_55]|nr:MAG: pantetheine-phosphate adenylyltransferase [Candidatus Cloacimonetes bacterium 4572_55]
MNIKRTAIYPGTFDPLTNGHLDLIQRSGKLFDELIIAVARHSGKKTMFTLEERVELIKKCTADLDYTTVESFSTLTVEFARKRGVSVVVRGMRVLSDFEYEFQMALSNRKMWSELETAFLLTNEAFSYMSSSLVRQVATLNGDLTPFVPLIVKKAILKKLHGDSVASQNMQ